MISGACAGEAEEQGEIFTVDDICKKENLESITQILLYEIESDDQKPAKSKSRVKRGKVIEMVENPLTSDRGKTKGKTRGNAGGKKRGKRPQGTKKQASKSQSPKSVQHTPLNPPPPPPLPNSPCPPPSPPLPHPDTKLKAPLTESQEEE